MPAIYNDSTAVRQLRQSLNKTINDLKNQHKECEKLIKEASSFWTDDQYKVFSNDYNQATKTFELLFKAMKEYDEKVLKLEIALRKYEESNPRIRKI